MKRFIFFEGGALVLALSIMAGCSGPDTKNTRQTDALVTDFSVVETIKSASQSYRLTSPDDSAYFELSTTLQWPERFGDHPLDSLQHSLLLAAYNFDGTDPDQAIRGFVGSPDIFDGAYVITPCDSVGMLEASPQNYEMEVKATVAELTEQSVTYVVAVSSYLGGAHPNTFTTPMTYVFADRVVLTTANVFGQGSETAVETAVREALAAQFDVPVNRLSDAGFFGNDIPMASTIYASQGNIVFHYNPYEIAPYSLGVIDVEVPAYALRESLTSMAKAFFKADGDM